MEIGELEKLEYIPIDKVKIGKYRVRTTFDDEKMRSLVRSIKHKKVLSPIWVKPADKQGYYELIAGERRLRATKEAGLKEIPVNIRDVQVDEAIIDMGIENLQREDLSFYERGRWVAKMKELGWTVSALAEETGIPNQNLFDWLEFYNESERIKSVPDYREAPVEKLPLTGLLGVKRAPISDQKKTELAIATTQYPESERPTVREIHRATRIIEQEPQITAEEAIERARGITLLLPIPTDLMVHLKRYATNENLSVQDAIITILREFFE